VVLFVYNRPDHTRRTLESLAANPLAGASVLHVYADGPKDKARAAELDRIARAREVLRERDWCGEVHILESPKNKGLAASIIDGVTDVVSRFGRVIVLEDDLVVSPGLLEYMNDALALYADDEEVMQISSYLPVPSRLPSTSEAGTFFLRGHETCSGGWATWKRAWNRLDTDPELLKARVYASGRVDEFTWDSSGSWLTQLDQNISGELTTWAIKWHTTIFLDDGLCLYPRRTLVRNVGFDGSGVHSGFDAGFDPGDPLAARIRVDRIPLADSTPDRLAFSAFYLERQRHAVGRHPWRLIKRCVPIRAKRLIRRTCVRTVSAARRLSQT
jgi:GT2 family glycosyltransferase